MRSNTGIGLVLMAVLSWVVGFGCAEEKKPTGHLPPESPQQLLTTSLHNTTRGMEHWYSAQQGSLEGITQIPYADLGCKDCHVAPSNCTQCHAIGGDTPVDAKCLACHGRQQAEIDQALSDVHRDRGMVCVDCHGESDAHGDGHSYDSMLEEGAIDARCTNAACHPEATLPTNTYHAQHLQDLECSACHVQSVVTCLNCHFESEVAGEGQLPFGRFKDWKFLVKRTRSGKVDAANLQTVTYHGKAFVALAPYYAHTVARNAVSSCQDCHAASATQEYQRTGSIEVVTWNEAQKRLVPRTGIIPVPQDWKTSMKFAFATIDSVHSSPDQRVWKKIDPTEVGKQMLFAEPLENMPH